MYTDNYNDSGESNSVELEEKSSSKKSGIIIVVVLTIIIAGLVYFLINKKTDNNEIKEKFSISLYPETIVVPFGGTSNVSFDVRNDGVLVLDASIRLTSLDENIFTVDNLTLKGVEYGKATLKAEYVDPNGKTIETKKQVVVADGDPNVLVTGIALPDGDLQLPLNGTFEIPLNITPSDGYIESKVFTSSNSSVAMVDNHGKVTAISEGETTIDIDINNGMFKEKVNVLVSSDYEMPAMVISPTKVEIDSKIEKLGEGETATLAYKLTPEKAVATSVKWISSDPDIIEVDKNGKITAIKEGSAVIKVSINDDISDNIAIKVEKNNILITDISLVTDNYILLVGQTQTIIPTITPDDATDKTLTYVSTNTDVATVQVNDDMSGMVTAVSVGVTTITIKSESSGITKTVTVNVEKEPETGGECGSNAGLKCKDGEYAHCGKCKTCEAGYYCRNNVRTKCSEGSTSQKGASACTKTTCSAGQGLDSTKSTGCSSCPKGTYSPDKDGICHSCPSGKTTSKDGATSEDDCNVTVTPTPKATPKPTATATATPTNTPKPESKKCDAGYYLTAGGECKICPKDYYCINNVYTKCPTDSTTNGQEGKTKINDCICKAGKYLNNNTCSICPEDYYCPGDNKKHSCVEVGAENTGGKAGSTSSSDCGNG